MMSNINFADIGNFPLEIPQQLNAPFTFMNSVLRKAILYVIHSISIFCNSLGVLLCYVYLKNFRQHSTILVEGYKSIFKVFAEYISATICVCYGLLEMDLHHLVLGVIGIAMGLCLKALLMYQQKLHKDGFIKYATRASVGLYLVTIFICCRAFHDLTLKVGALHCATRIITCVLPLVALSDNFMAGGEVLSSLCADVLAVSSLWWHCSQLSLKYFIVVPSIIGALFTVIRYILDEIQKAASEEVETDLYE